MMEKREKILIAIMLIAIAYGGLEFFYFSRQVEPAAVSSNINIQVAREMAQQLSKDLADNTVTPQQQYILEAAAARWRDDLFYRLPEAEAVQSAPLTADQSETPFDYTGYLEVGGRKMAIVNGMEYQTGDMLAQGGYILTEITSAKVVLKTKQGGKTVIVPYREQ